MPKVSDIVGRPQVHFDDPIALAQAPALSKDEKLVALATWERDAETLELATGEGMPPAPNEDHGSMRDEIEAAAEIVQSDTRPAPPTNQTQIDPDRHVSLPTKADPAAA